MSPVTNAHFTISVLRVIITVKRKKGGTTPGSLLFSPDGKTHATSHSSLPPPQATKARVNPRRRLLAALALQRELHLQLHFSIWGRNDGIGQSMLPRLASISISRLIGRLPMHLVTRAVIVAIFGQS
jgi:hypothetical protein